MARPRKNPILNPALHDAIIATGATYEALAAVVRRVGWEAGLSLQYSGSTLGKWVNGAHPVPEGIDAVVEAFARELDRPELTASDLGWSDHAPGRPRDPWAGSVATWISDLGRDDMLNRRTALTSGLYSLAALTGLPAFTARPRDHRRAGASDIDRIRRTGDAFDQFDDLYGGGHARRMISAYLHHEVAPLLHGTTGRTRPDLFSAAAELTYLAAWMAADDDHHPLAQRYYIQAVRLADEAADPIMRATALRSLALHACELGHGRHAQHITEAAYEAVHQHGAPARKRAFVLGMHAEASAHASGGKIAARLLVQAETELDKADSPAVDGWSGNYRRESLEHQIGNTLAALGDHAGAVRHLTASLASRRTIERRTSTLISVRLAHAHLRLRQPDQAAATILKLRDDLPAVTSGRVDRELLALRHAWRPFLREPTITEADQLLRTSRHAFTTSSSPT